MKLLARKGGEIEERNPMALLSDVRSELERLWDRFASFPWRTEEFPTLFGSGWNPAVEMWDAGKEILIRCELPGVDPKDIEITMAGGSVTISGKKEEQAEEKKKGYYYSEAKYGSFERTIPLPAEADADSVTAEHEDGVTTLHFRKLHPESVKQVPVKVVKK